MREPEQVKIFWPLCSDSKEVVAQSGEEGGSVILSSIQSQVGEPAARQGPAWSSL